MKIGELHGRGRPVFSFEFFPPKTVDGVHTLMATVADLEDALQPDFVSVTYGAGGSTRDRSIDVVTRIQKELATTAMAHLTCVGSNEGEIAHVVDRFVAAGIENVLALRGDPPKEPPAQATGDKATGDNKEGTAPAGFQKVPGGFAHATELTEFLASRWQLDLGGACYPEGHLESTSPADDLKWTKVKVEKGAKFLITQLFFDNQDYFAFVARARAAGITVPIVPGIMPITNVAQIERFTKMCGAKIPHELAGRMRRAASDPAHVMAAGIEHAIKQCRKLLEGGAPGLHFYTLNKSFATRSILAAVRKE
jgi:methylenetetrahydrofolate reductase (NADPH)